ERAPFYTFCLNHSAEARRSLHQRRAEARFVEIVGGGKAGYTAANDNDFGYGLNSRTKSTTARTWSTGVSGRMPCPRLKMWPGRDPVRRRSSCTRAFNSGSGARRTAGSKLPWMADR